MKRTLDKISKSTYLNIVLEKSCNEKINGFGNPILPPFVNDNNYEFDTKFAPPISKKLLQIYLTEINATYQQEKLSQILLLHKKYLMTDNIHKLILYLYNNMGEHRLCVYYVLYENHANISSINDYKNIMINTIGKIYRHFNYMSKGKWDQMIAHINEEMSDKFVYHVLKNLNISRIEYTKIMHYMLNNHYIHKFIMNNIQYFKLFDEIQLNHILYNDNELYYIIKLIERNFKNIVNSVYQKYMSSTFSNYIQNIIKNMYQIQKGKDIIIKHPNIYGVAQVIDIKDKTIYLKFCKQRCVAHYDIYPFVMLQINGIRYRYTELYHYDKTFSFIMGLDTIKKMIEGDITHPCSNFLNKNVDLSITSDLQYYLNKIEEDKIWKRIKSFKCDDSILHISIPQIKLQYYKEIIEIVQNVYPRLPTSLLIYMMINFLPSLF